MSKTENIVDDQGTTQEQARKMLEKFCREGFENDSEKCALVLGRTADEIDGFINGDETIDDDLMMKMRGIAEQRNIEIE
jgi:hypothetical protein